MRTAITVRYWLGTSEAEEIAYTYAGAMKIAARNRNKYDPTFWESGRKLIDDGCGLAYEDEAEDGRRVYAVMRLTGRCRP